MPSSNFSAKSIGITCNYAKLVMHAHYLIGHDVRNKILFALMVHISRHA